MNGKGWLVGGILGAIGASARSVRVEYDAARTNVAALLKATADAGYPATPEKQVRP